MTSWVNRYLPSTEFILDNDIPLFIKPQRKVFELEAMRNDADEITSGEKSNQQYQVLSKGFKKTLEGGKHKKNNYEARYGKKFYQGYANNRYEFANKIINTEKNKKKKMVLNIKNNKTGKIYVMKYFLY